MILRNANIICSTLSFSGSTIFSQLENLFDVVIIDEASQAVEPSILLPLSKAAKQVYLVGDHSQLPATVISQRAVDQGYNMGLFGRLMKAGYPIQRIKIQYRMHPLIREFPSASFYCGLLQDGPMAEKQTTRTWHREICFGPFVVYDIRGTEKKAPESSSVLRVCEAQCASAIYLNLVARYQELKTSTQFGLICPYKGQIEFLRQSLSEVFGGSDITRDLVDINSLDGFQGQEKDVVIFSVAKTRMNKSTEKKCFVADERRLNVGLTRARSSVIIIGNMKSLCLDFTWKSLIEHCKAKSKIFKISTKNLNSLNRNSLNYYCSKIQDIAGKIAKDTS